LDDGQLSVHVSRKIKEMTTRWYLCHPRHTYGPAWVLDELQVHKFWSTRGCQSSCTWDKEGIRKVGHQKARGGGKASLRPRGGFRDTNDCNNPQHWDILYNRYGPQFLRYRFRMSEMGVDPIPRTRVETDGSEKMGELTFDFYQNQPWL
jgi:hypothetical protein